MLPRILSPDQGIDRVIDGGELIQFQFPWWRQTNFPISFIWIPSREGGYMGPIFFIRPLSPRGEDMSVILLQIIAQKPAEWKAHRRGVIL